MTAKSIWQRIRSLRSGPALGGGLIAGHPTPVDSDPAVLSAGLRVMSRDQVSAADKSFPGAINGLAGHVVIVEPDGYLTGSPEDIERAAACGMLRRYEREGES